MPEPEKDVQHVVVRFSNSQTALLAACITGGPVTTLADVYLAWLKEQQ